MEMEWESQLGHWLKIFPQAWSHTVLGEQVFRENVLIRYQIRSNEFPEKCKNCATNKPFTL